MLKGRGRDPRAATAVPAHLARLPMHTQIQNRPSVPAQTRMPLAKPEPDYEVVEFPSEQYVNAKLQPPPPPPPRPITGHPAVAGASCGLCGGGGARVRCAECGRRALCASCDDMYHRHPKRRHHQRQALTSAQLREERPPLPPKATPPVPPPRRHKLSGDRSSASPRPPGLDQRRATLGHLSTPQTQQVQIQSTMLLNNHNQNHQIPAHLQSKLAPQHAEHLGSMPYLPSNLQHATAPVQPQLQSNTLAAWGRQRGSLQGFNVQPNMQGLAPESWESPESSISPSGQNSPWGRPLRRGASVLELGGQAPSPGCAHCGPTWRYGSCASLDVSAWPGAWPPACCMPPAHGAHPAHHMHPHQHMHPPYTPQPYRRAESRAVSRAASRAGSRAASPAMSVRSRTSRRTKHRTPSPPPLPSSDADSESESNSDRAPPPHKSKERREPQTRNEEKEPKHIKEESLGPAPSPPTASWQCEHCTFVNEPGVRVCVVCCRTPTTVPKVVADIQSGVSRLTIADKSSPSPILAPVDDSHSKQNGDTRVRSVKERASIACGPSPPREEKPKKPLGRLVTPSRDPCVSDIERVVKAQSRHDMSVGPSPAKEKIEKHLNMVTGPSPPNREMKESELPVKHSVSVGPSPPRDNTLRPLIETPQINTINVQKKSAGTSPPRQIVIESTRSTSNRNVSNTGTSPPPQSISTQTYEVPNSSERAQSVSRSRPRRRFRDDSRRERSHSRHSLSSDTRESDRSVRTSGGHWEWREPRDSSPGGEWSGSERRPTRLARRASHLDLHRARPVRRSSFYGSEAASPERFSSNRAASLEVLAGAGTRREAERGLELARLMTDAEKLGFSAAEVHAALAQNPVAPLAWLCERWPSLCAGVRAAAARLATGSNITDNEARAALARHRGAMWPAVTDCVERHRRQVEVLSVGEEGRLRGRVWGSPAGADDDAAPPASSRHSIRARAEDSSDEFEAPIPTKYEDDDWMYLPLEPPARDVYEYEKEVVTDFFKEPCKSAADIRTEDIAIKLKTLLIQAGVPSIDENLLLKGLLADNTVFKPGSKNSSASYKETHDRPHSMDFAQSENDFIDAYNALTRLSPLPNVNNPIAQTPQHVLNSVPTNSQNTAFDSNISDAQAIHRNNDANDKEGKQYMSMNQPQLDPEILEAESDQNQQNDVKIVIIPPSILHTEEIKDSDTKNNNNQPVPAEVYSTEQPLHEIDKTESNTQPLKNENIAEMSNQSTSVPKPNYSDIPLNSQKKTSSQRSENKQEEEKTNNLNDIVDDTQRLIQQMKAEINSDINSLGSHSISKSEADNSSNESEFSSEQESSYSETEGETEDISSDENFGTEGDAENVQSQRSGTVMNRTSSEENDQFEEAMDHIEEQNESFKQTNIEILDTIAKSLQEDHTISLELNHSVEVVKHEEPSASESENIKSDMVNQGFQAIKYDKPDPGAPNTVNLKQESPVQPILKTKKQDLNNNPFIEVNSFEEIYEELTSSTNSSTRNKIDQNVKNNKEASLQEGQIKKSKKSPITIMEKVDKITSQFKIPTPTKLFVSNDKPQSFNAILETAEETIFEEVINSPVTNAFKTNIEIIKVEPINSSKNSFVENELNEINGDEDSDTDSSRSTISPLKENTALRNIISNETIQDSKGTNSVQTVHPHAINEPTDLETPTVIDSIKNVQDETVNNTKSKSTEKLSPPKSHIPKLVKILPNHKPKIDKNVPKVIASKVPVRRGSIKQYPAPAPPKTHFGNVQNGHVKQLQTRLFNSKTSKIASPSKTTIEVVPSTSSINKKRPAPLPPSESNEKNQLSSPKASPPKESNHYFRETCRTEDEWTESDSEDSQLPIGRQNSEEPIRAPSPPPPVTVRRVSGQLVDLARVRLLEGSPERQARMLLAEGVLENWDQAQLAVELVSRGTEPPAALLAALECVDLNSALAYLHQDCELCASRLPEYEMVSMLRCLHRCCRECARHYFTVQITERSIADCVCPYCKEPELEILPEDSWLEYFAHLDILLKTLIEADVHELFQRKLRDRTLARDPNFRWCVECSSGFFVHPKQKKLRCPECKSVSCATCRKPWTSNHEGLSCEQYATWLEDNDPERSVAAVQQHLRENGLECPRCRFKYSLSRGGCMHFTCTQCKYEFCYGCGKPFMMGARCGLSEYCARLGLHAHHPRNCLFYLRDKEPHDLQTLLQMNNINYETEASAGSTNRCPVQLQKETPTGLIDTACGSEVPLNHAGLCKVHYVEYLAGLARGLDPIPIMEVSELVAELRRRALPLPERGPWDTDPIYAGMCAEIVKEKIPLD